MINEILGFCLVAWAIARVVEVWLNVLTKAKRLIKKEREE